ncbi:hypothetical protein QJQ45_008943 [Haematococcus lacustris]|nr:hypothetical protein QJQ45_008943 [Haematococcus lacustris]
MLAQHKQQCTAGYRSRLPRTTVVVKIPWAEPEDLAPDFMEQLHSRGTLSDPALALHCDLLLNGSESGQASGSSPSLTLHGPPPPSTPLHPHPSPPAVGEAGGGATRGVGGPVDEAPLLQLQRQLLQQQQGLPAQTPPVGDQAIQQGQARAGDAASAATPQGAGRLAHGHTFASATGPAVAGRAGGARGQGNDAAASLLDRFLCSAVESSQAALAHQQSLPVCPSAPIPPESSSLAGAGSLTSRLLQQPTPGLLAKAASHVPGFGRCQSDSGCGGSSSTRASSDITPLLLLLLLLLLLRGAAAEAPVAVEGAPAAVAAVSPTAGAKSRGPPPSHPRKAQTSMSSRHSACQGDSPATAAHLAGMAAVLSFSLGGGGDSQSQAGGGWASEVAAGARRRSLDSGRVPGMTWHEAPQPGQQSQWLPGQPQELVSCVPSGSAAEGGGQLDGYGSGEGQEGLMDEVAPSDWVHWLYLQPPRGAEVLVQVSGGAADRGGKQGSGPNLTLANTHITARFHGRYLAVQRVDLSSAELRQLNKGMPMQLPTPSSLSAMPLLLGAPPATSSTHAADSHLTAAAVDVEQARAVHATRSGGGAAAAVAGEVLPTDVTAGRVGRPCQVPPGLNPSACVVHLAVHGINMPGMLLLECWSGRLLTSRKQVVVAEDVRLVQELGALEGSPAELLLLSRLGDSPGKGSAGFVSLGSRSLGSRAAGIRAQQQQQGMKQEWQQLRDPQAAVDPGPPSAPAAAAAAAASPPGTVDPPGALAACGGTPLLDSQRASDCDAPTAAAAGPAQAAAGAAGAHGLPGPVVDQGHGQWLAAPPAYSSTDQPSAGPPAEASSALVVVSQAAAQSQGEELRHAGRTLDSSPSWPAVQRPHPPPTLTSALTRPLSSQLVLAARHKAYQAQMVDVAVQLLEHCCSCAWRATAAMLMDDLMDMGCSYAYVKRATSGGGMTLLHRAVCSGSQAMVKLVVAWGNQHNDPWNWSEADPNTGITPLHVAAIIRRGEAAAQSLRSPPPLNPSLSNDGAIETVDRPPNTLADWILQEYEAAWQFWHGAADVTGSTPADVAEAHAWAVTANPGSTCMSASNTLSTEMAALPAPSQEGAACLALPAPPDDELPPITFSLDSATVQAAMEEGAQRQQQRELARTCDEWHDSWPTLLPTVVAPSGASPPDGVDAALPPSCLPRVLPAQGIFSLDPDPKPEVAPRANPSPAQCRAVALSAADVATPTSLLQPANRAASPAPSSLAPISPNQPAAQLPCPGFTAQPPQPLLAPTPGGRGVQGPVLASPTAAAVSPVAAAAAMADTQPCAVEDAMRSRQEDPCSSSSPATSGPSPPSRLVPQAVGGAGEGLGRRGSMVAASAGGEAATAGSAGRLDAQQGAGRQLQAGSQRQLLQALPASWASTRELAWAGLLCFPSRRVESRYVGWVTQQNVMLKYMLLAKFPVFVLIIALKEWLQGEPASWLPLLPWVVPGLVLLSAYCYLPASSSLRGQMLGEPTWICILFWGLLMKTLQATGVLAVPPAIHDVLLNYVDSLSEGAVQVFYQIRFRHVLLPRCLYALATVGVYLQVHPPHTPLFWVMLPAFAWNAVMLLASWVIDFATRRAYVLTCLHFCGPVAGRKERRPHHQHPRPLTRQAPPLPASSSTTRRAAAALGPTQPLASTETEQSQHGHAQQKGLGLSPAPRQRREAVMHAPEAQGERQLLGGRAPAQCQSKGQGEGRGKAQAQAQGQGTEGHRPGASRPAGLRLRQPRQQADAGGGNAMGDGGSVLVRDPYQNQQQQQQYEQQQYEQQQQQQGLEDALGLQALRSSVKLLLMQQHQQQQYEQQQQHAGQRRSLELQLEQQGQWLQQHQLMQQTPFQEQQLAALPPGPDTRQQQAQTQGLRAPGAEQQQHGVAQAYMQQASTVPQLAASPSPQAWWSALAATSRPPPSSLPHEPPFLQPRPQPGMQHAAVDYLLPSPWSPPTHHLPPAARPPAPTSAAPLLGSGAAPDTGRAAPWLLGPGPASPGHVEATARSQLQQQPGLEWLACAMQGFAPPTALSEPQQPLYQRLDLQGQGQGQGQGQAWAQGQQQQWAGLGGVGQGQGQGRGWPQNQAQATAMAAYPASAPPPPLAMKWTGEGIAWGTGSLASSLPPTHLGHTEQAAVPQPHPFCPHAYAPTMPGVASADAVAQASAFPSPPPWSGAAARMMQPATEGVELGRAGGGGWPPGPWPGYQVGGAMEGMQPVPPLSALGGWNPHQGGQGLPPEGQHGWGGGQAAWQQQQAWQRLGLQQQQQLQQQAWRARQDNDWEAQGHLYPQR